MKFLYFIMWNAGRSSKIFGHSFLNNGIYIMQHFFQVAFPMPLTDLLLQFSPLEILIRVSGYNVGSMKG